MTQYERRFLQSDLEVRRVGETARITGYTAVFNKDADIMGMFTEHVAPGAFKKTIKDGDIRALQNHDPNFVLGRTKSGTLKLAEDTRGLHYNIDANLRKTTVRDLVEDIERGDISQSSFGFLAVHDEWDYQTEPPKRTLLENRLFDVSPVTFPAYEDTDAQMNALSVRSRPKPTRYPISWTRSNAENCVPIWAINHASSPNGCTGDRRTPTERPGRTYKAIRWPLGEQLKSP